MATHFPRLPIALDPLIAEAKRRMHRRRLMVLGLLAMAGLAVGLTFVLRPPPKPPAPLAQQQAPPPPGRLIVLNRSIGPFRLGEPRAQVEREFGPGNRGGHFGAMYFAGRIEVNYVYKVGLTNRIQGLRVNSDRYRTQSGLHVGSSLADVRRLLHASCGPNDACSVGHGPGGPETMFWMRHGKVAWIQIWFLS